MDPATEESSRLLARAQEGDARAVEELLERHLPGLRAFVRLRASPALLEHESSSDLVQSVCLEILRHPGRFEHGGEAGFRHWLYTTALRKLSNRRDFWAAGRREAARGVALPADPEAADAMLLARYSSFCTPSRAAMAREELARVEAAFRELPDDQRQVIVLAKVVGLSRAEIGREMGRSELAVRSLLSRALSRLAEVLG